MIFYDTGGIWMARLQAGIISAELGDVFRSQEQWLQLEVLTPEQELILGYTMDSRYSIFTI